MALSPDVLSTKTEPTTTTVDLDRARAYAAATNDDNPAYASGTYVPPVFGVVPTWGSLAAITARVIPPEALLLVVHGEQDMYFAQPLVANQTLTTTAEAFSVRGGRSGTRFTMRLTSVDADGAPVLLIYTTLFARGLSDYAKGGPDKPDHTFPEAARAAKVAEYTIHIDDDQTFRYRDASGDRMPIHTDIEVVRSVGLPGIIVHGLCALAMCSQAVLKTVAGGDPSRLKRLAARFSALIFPDSDLVVSIYRVDDPEVQESSASYAFEAHSRGELVIAHGRAEVGTGAEAGAG